MMRSSSSLRFPNPGWAWPKGGRAQLLEAALLMDQTQAREALNRWLQSHDLDDINFADHRLLAAIAERHSRNIADLAEFPRMRGLQRQLWTQSRMRVNAVLPMLQALVANGVEIMLLKGAARIALNPDAQRQRAHQDVDILVRGDQIQLAARILSAQDWQTVRGDSALSAVARSPATRAINFKKLPWGDIDLHRLAYHGANYHPTLDVKLWERAERAEYFGVPVLVPEGAERLAMTLSYGAWSAQAHSDWLVDAADILATGAVDWPYFMEITAKRRIIGQVRIGLSYLHNKIGLPLPLEAQNLLNGNCGIATLFIAHTEKDLPRWLRPVRRILYSMLRTKRDRSVSEKIPPLKLSIARTSQERLSENSATSADIAAGQLTNLGKYNFYADLIIKSPLCRRRIELELNSEHENLARFRIFAAPSASGTIRTRISTEIQLNAPAQHLTLTLRAGTLLTPGHTVEENSKYAALPFRLVKCRVQSH